MDEHLQKFTQDISLKGFAIIDHVFENEEIEAIVDQIAHVDTSQPSFRKATGVFAIRKFLQAIPGVMPIIFNRKLKTLIQELFGEDFFCVKSIYFDKPAQSNWFVQYHQDLTISVDKKIEIDGFGPWTRKLDQFGVQPPCEMLENNFTIRIHLDDTDKNNGALKVLRGSHLKKIFRPELIDHKIEKETYCEVKKGGVMIMKPLLMHASDKSLSGYNRRVIHLEFSKSYLPEPIQWSELVRIFN